MNPTVCTEKLGQSLLLQSLWTWDRDRRRTHKAWIFTIWPLTEKVYWLLLNMQTLPSCGFSLPRNFSKGAGAAGSTDLAWTALMEPESSTLQKFRVWKESASTLDFKHFSISHYKLSLPFKICYYLRGGRTVFSCPWSQATTETLVESFLKRNRQLAEQVEEIHP